MPDDEGATAAAEHREETYEQEVFKKFKRSVKIPEGAETLPSSRGRRTSSEEQCREQRATPERNPSLDPKSLSILLGVALS